MLRRQTYVSALFIATRLPLGFFYFCVVAIGLAAGLTGALIVVGIPAIVLSFALAWGFAAFERHLVRWWLGVDIAPLSPPRPADVAASGPTPPPIRADFASLAS